MVKLSDAKICLVISGGPIDLEFAAEYLKGRRFFWTIAVDAGLETAKKLDIVPDMVVGDLDSLDPTVTMYFRNKENLRWDVHDSEKNESDTELALQWAAKMGCEEIAILGATGGRLDHFIGNVHLLYPCMQKGIFAYLIDPQNKIYLTDCSRRFVKKKLWGKYISFLPLTQEVRGITLTGFKYPLGKKDIEIGTSLCISNELKEEEGYLVFEEGVLICIESHDKD